MKMDNKTPSSNMHTKEYAQPSMKCKGRNSVQKPTSIKTTKRLTNTVIEIAFLHSNSQIRPNVKIDDCFDVRHIQIKESDA
mmetsp:Transcript_8016/g.11684  ORF Transcript_8016/g.11684 Transcript_8016/m.11684 type:complete len:81 (-) Transcript_8016:15-257(-)